MTAFFRLSPPLRHAVLAFSLSGTRSRPHHPQSFSTTSAIMTSTTGRSYADAIDLLESLPSNRAIVSSISDAPRDMNLDAIPEMLEWTRKARYDVGDFAKGGLKCIHVAGTKGKGSVCVMVESILLQYRRRDGDGMGKIGEDKDLGKIGLYTSPHLITVRERIRIDGAPISESLFTRYFFELWDRFSAATTSSSFDVNPPSVSLRPGYFRYLTLLAFHAFMEERVETAIVECGIGGEYDSTNILPPEAVTVSAITKLGIDHVGMLGTAIEKIAWHKGGIMKKGVPVYTVEQVLGAQAILENCAVDRGTELTVVGRHPELELGEIKLGLGGDFQKDNASLAVAVAASHLRNMGITVSVPSFEEVLTSREKLPSQFVKGLETASWPGRWEVRKEGNIEWLIDGAHTVDSIEATAYWYIEKLQDAMNDEITPTATMLIFNQQDRDAFSLMRTFLKAIMAKVAAIKPLDSRTGRMRFTPYYNMFTYAAFCTNVPFKDQVPEGLDLSPQEATAKLYESLAANRLHLCFGSVEEAVESARRVSEGDERVLVLVTGSLYLVGGLLRVLERDAVAQTDPTSPAKPSGHGVLPGLEHAMEEHATGEQEPISPTHIHSRTEITLRTIPYRPYIHYKNNKKRNKARKEVIDAFLSDAGIKAPESFVSGNLVEDLGPSTAKSSDSQIAEHTSNVQKEIQKPYWADTDSPASRDAVKSSVAVSDPHSQHPKTRHIPGAKAGSNTGSDH